MRPHLIHIGFPKCASTFLQEWFDAHPQVSYRPGGIGGLHSIYHLVEDVLDTSETYLCDVTSSEHLVMPREMIIDREVGVTPPAATWAATERMSKELKKRFPEAKLLIVTRNFEDIIRSGFSQIIREGGALIDKYIEKHGMFSQLADQAYAFDKAIDIYREDFGNNVIVLPYELLASDRRRFLSLVEDAMGVDTFDIPKRKSNVSLSPNEIYWYPRFAAIIHFVPSDRVRSLLRRFHRKMIAVGGWKPLVGLLRLIFGKRQQEFAFLKDLVPKLYNRADKLRQLEIYAPYRKGYGRD